MRPKFRLLGILCAAMLGASGAARAAGDYLLATASTGGTYYPVGVALSTLVKVKLQPINGINLSAINSAGSAENIKLMRTGEVQFAILQGLYGSYAWSGTGPLEKDGPQKELRSICMLWQNVEHFVVRSEFATTGTIDDLLAMKGKSAAFGEQNSGTIGSNRKILSHLGVDLDKDYELFYGGYGASADALQDGKVDAISTPAGVPVSAITKAFAAAGDGIRLLGFTPEQAKQADGGLNLWTPYVITGGTYPSVDKDVHTIAQPNFLAVRADVSDDVVYEITKTIFESLRFLQGIHKATTAMSLDKALSGLPMPLHPGAVRYFREVGLEIPAKLIAK